MLKAVTTRSLLIYLGPQVLLAGMLKAVESVSLWVFILSGLAMLAVSWSIDNLRLVRLWHFTVAFDDILPFRRIIRLHEAVRWARDKTINRFMMSASEGLSDDEPLQYLANALAMPDPTFKQRSQVRFGSTAVDTIRPDAFSSRSTSGANFTSLKVARV